MDMSFLIKSIAWTFAHSLWQGLVAALIAAVIISTTKKSTAKLRYNLLAMLLSCFLLSSVITFWRELSTEAANSAISPSLILRQANEFVASSADTNLSDNLASWFNSNASLFIIAWAIFFLLNCIKLVAGLSSINRLRHYKTTPVAEEWLEKLNQLKNNLHIKQTISILQSELVKVPVAMGYFKPVILVPIGLLTHIPPEQVETVLLHELAHIRRKDYLVNLIQHLVESIFFFNPAFIWISSLLRQEREACCDDIVVAHTGQKKVYLNALVAFQEYSMGHTRYMMGFSNKKEYLLGRVKRMITNENKRLNLVEKFLLFSGLILFSAFTYITQQPDNEVIDLPAKAEVATMKTDLNATDTVPAKKQVPQKAKSKPAPKKVTNAEVKNEKKARPENRPEKQSTDTSIHRTLLEIQTIKDKIGEKKESIGEKKAELKEVEGKDKQKEVELNNQIEKERDEIDGIRKELDKKRVELERQKRIKFQESKGEKIEKNEPRKFGLNNRQQLDKKLFVNKDNKLFVKKEITKHDVKVVQFDRKDNLDLKEKIELKDKNIFAPKSPPVKEKKMPPPGMKIKKPPTRVTT